VSLSAEQSGHGLVLFILRGFPGYQCPYCVKQVHDFAEHASDFKAKNTKVHLVYPGPSADLDQHAKEFLEKQAELPSNVVLVTTLTIRSPTSTDCAGTRRTTRLIHLRSLSTEAAPWCSRRSLTATATALSAGDALTCGVAPRSFRCSLSSTTASRTCKAFLKRLLVLLTVLIALSSFCPTQLREVGTGAPGPVKAPHLSAELVSDSGTISPGDKTRVALALTLEPGWHVYWVYAGDSGGAPEVQWSVPPGYLWGRYSMRPQQDCLSDPRWTTDMSV
jgi:hypothetical protein